MMKNSTLTAKKLVIMVVPWLLFIVIFSLLLRLGFWQLERADGKQQLLDTKAAQQSAEAISLEELVQLDKVQFKPLLLDGKWLSQWNFYLDNRIQNAVPGYNLFSMFADQSGRVIFVDRGWRHFKKGRNFDFTPPAKNQTKVLGYTYQPGLYKIVALPLPNKDQIIPIPGLHIEQLVEFFKTKNMQLAPFILRQTFPQTEAGLLRQWEIIEIPPERHMGYAVQWFAMAFTLVLMSGMILWKRIKHSAMKRK